MGNRRMFSKTIIGSGKFLQMPPTSRLLYYDLGMAADDDGVVEAYTVMQTTKATNDDLRVLISKGYIKVLNEELVAVIMDWSENNYIQKDRYHPSIYKDLLLQLDLENAGFIGASEDGSRAYPNCIQNGNQVDTEVKLSKDKLSKVKSIKDKPIERKRSGAVYFPNDDTLNAAFSDYVDMRKKIKKPMTDRAVELAIKKLQDLADGDQDKMITILNRSIERSWSGLYPLDEDKSRNAGRGDKTPDEVLNEWRNA